MNFNLLVHVDLNDAQRLNLAFDNITNYLNFLPEHEEAANARVALVANGPAVQLFTSTESNAELEKRGRMLMEGGLSVRLCQNAIRKFGIDRASLWKGCEVIEGGIAEIVKLQNEGFCYIKP